MSLLRPWPLRSAALVALMAALVSTGIPIAAVGPRPAQAAPVTYEIDTAHSHLGFRIRHLISKVAGQFETFSGTIVHDAASPASSSVEVTIDPASIDTNQPKRDDDLRGPNFFDVAKHPQMGFKSRTVKIDGTKLTIEGDLTMHGVTKPITLHGEVGGSMKGPGGSKRTGFSATATINRKDFGLEWNKSFDEGGTLLGDDVEVEIEIEAVEKAPAAGTK